MRLSSRPGLLSSFKMPKKDLNKRFAEFEKKKKGKIAPLSDLDRKFLEKKSRKQGFLGRLFGKKPKSEHDESVHKKKLSELENELEKLKNNSKVRHNPKKPSREEAHKGMKKEKHRDSFFSGIFQKEAKDRVSRPETKSVAGKKAVKAEDINDSHAPPKIMKNDAPEIKHGEKTAIGPAEKPDGEKMNKPSHAGFSLFKKKPKKESPDEVQEKDIRKLFRAKDKEKKKKITAAERKRKLVMYLEKSGLELDQQQLSKRLFYASIGITLLFTFLYVYLDVSSESTVAGIFGHVLILWTLGLLCVWGIVWIIFRIYLDLLIFRRKLSIEEVLPDFLQLTSANLRAGMPIDRALWFAVRPRFGVLAKEIEDVAKRTIAGEALDQALLDFAKRYDSQTLLRSVYLLNEGMDAGGDVGDLLNKIAINITEMRGMRKEMAANVMTYVIFITFASIVAAPALFSLSNQLLTIVQKIAGNVAGSTGTQSTGFGLTINISDDTISLTNYKIFAYICLTMTSVFSAVIVATIKKGNVKEGLQYIPIFIIVALIVFFIGSHVLGMVFAGMF